MKTADFIAATLNEGRNLVLAMLADLRGHLTVMPTTRGGNHALWLAGHITMAEAAIVLKYALGENDPVEKWRGLFGIGTTSNPDAGVYPSLDEILKEWERIRARVLEVLSTMKDEDFDKPSLAPKEFPPSFATIGGLFGAACSHQMLHAGQLTDIRRVVGLKPVMA